MPDFWRDEVNTTSAWLDEPGSLSLSLYATGWNGDGQLGLGDTANRNMFTFVGSGYTAIAMGTYSC